MKGKTIVIAASCLLLGIVAGRVSVSTPLRKAQSQTHASTAHDPALELTQPHVFFPSETNLQSQAVRDHISSISNLPEPSEKSALVVIPSEVLSAFSPNHRIADLSSPFFSDSSTDTLLAEQLQISPAERKLLERAWRRLRKDIKLHATTGATTQQNPDGSHTISIPAQSTNVKAALDQFTKSANKQLGENRAAAILALKQVPRIADSHGQAQSYRISTVNGSNGLQTYHLYHQVEGKPVISRTLSALPLHLRHITEPLGLKSVLPQPKEEPEY